MPRRRPRPKAAARPSIRKTGFAASSAKRSTTAGGTHATQPAADDDDRRRRSRPSCASSRRARSSRATIRRTYRSRSRSIRTRAASTAASTATRDRSHAYLDLSPGIDFETKLFAKPNAAKLLRAELREARLSSAIRSRSAPIPIRTSRSSANGRSRGGDRGARVLRSSADDHDQGRAASSATSTCSRRWRRRTSCACSSPSRCSTASSRASSTRAQRRRSAGCEIIKALERRRHSRSASTSRRSFRSSPTRTSKRSSRRPPQRGATHANWIMLRLPREVAPLFREWLDAHYPLRAAHVMSIVPADSRRARQRSALRLADGGQRRVCRPDRQAFRARVQAARPQHRARPRSTRRAIPAAASE